MKIILVTALYYQYRMKYTQVITNLLLESQSSGTEQEASLSSLEIYRIIIGVPSWHWRVRHSRVSKASLVSFKLRNSKCFHCCTWVFVEVVLDPDPCMVVTEVWHGHCVFYCIHYEIRSRRILEVERTILPKFQLKILNCIRIIYLLAQTSQWTCSPWGHGLRQNK